ncbi:unnamed protein product [Bursaphelenchus xylophilus]|uniref:(pine wood nematode) hypothetical protein n=1 Tax=Bursaphelenchus xylophilus TaxID=6326 RepID=A0A1I7S405_BURXY|nr:unnamed protein product [Bursaphelenchus xylophilus]CAG9116604.1 unnamed protein product [Bursaphelenchus xylophilus]
MFKRLKQASKRDGNRNTPQYEGPIQKRINLLYSIRDMNQEIINGIREIIRSFDDEENKKRNIYESFATGASILSNHMKGKDDEYSQCLNTIQKVYDDIGRAQHTLQSSLEERVCIPLEAWIKSDFARIELEIQRLHSLKRLVDKPNPQQPIEVTNNMKAFERQMEVVKHELLKLSQIKQDHWEKVANFTDVMRIYYSEVIKAIEKQGADKWRPEGLSAFKGSTERKNVVISGLSSGVSGGSTHGNNGAKSPASVKPKTSVDTPEDTDNHYENI